MRLSKLDEMVLDMILGFRLMKMCPCVTIMLLGMYIRVVGMYIDYIRVV